MPALTGVAAASAAGTASPALTVALTGITAASGAGTVVATHTVALTGAAMTTAIGSVGVSQAPVLVGLVLVGAQGALGFPTNFLGLDIVAPKFVLQFAGTTYTAGAVQVQMPAPRVALSGFTAVSGVLALRLPATRVQLQVVDTLAIAAPRPQVAFNGATAALGVLRATLPAAPTVALAGTTTAAGALALAPPRIVTALSGSTAAAGRLGVTLRALTLAMSGYSGTIGTLVLRLPVVLIDVEGYRPTLGYLDVALPAAYVQLTGAPAAGSGASTLVMQTERGALTQYTNYPFNSFAKFNGVFLGASDVGVFALSGTNDNGAIIDAAARVGLTDFDTSHLKRIERIYVGCRATGQMVLRVITEERWTRDYAIAPPVHAGLHGTHVKLGRGLEARYWQFELRNRDGSDFSVDIVEAKPIKLPRRVGGGNA